MDDIKVILTRRFHALLKEYNVKEHVLLEFVDKHDYLGTFHYNTYYNKGLLIRILVNDNRR